MTINNQQRERLATIIEYALIVLTKLPGIEELIQNQYEVLLAIAS